LMGLCELLGRDAEEPVVHVHEFAQGSLLLSAAGAAPACATVTRARLPSIGRTTDTASWP
jgi:hypothetical protein